jgi:CBS domain-containing protein
VDVERDGVLPIALLARPYGVELACPSHRTLDRIEAARAAGVIGGPAAATIESAFRFLLELQLRNDLRRLSSGEPRSRQLALSRLSAIERNRLKDALRAIRGWQEKAAYRWHLDLG